MVNGFAWHSVIEPLPTVSFNVILTETNSNLICHVAMLDH